MINELFLASNLIIWSLVLYNLWMLRLENKKKDFKTVTQETTSLSIEIPELDFKKQYPVYSKTQDAVEIWN